ncbi:MAG TPA: SAM-dependent methyltransferase [Lachnospiraceae bacterium]|nr:SAM-dependent methyltransferase [Lachnospiraceae bacterium]
MKPNYKNWMPKGMVAGTGTGAIISFVAFIIQDKLSLFGDGKLGKAVRLTALVLTIVLFPVTIWMILMYRAFSYNGKRQLSKHIIEGIADYVDIPDEGKGLDVGCGSGALTIACAKRNHKATMIGIDRWGKEYASFSKELCESNSKAEGVNNTAFEKGDALKLPYRNETFDAVTSNYVYHNIPSRDRQSILLETLRTLKKGGTFAIHDIMSKGRYGDMDAFAEKLRDMGYAEVRLIDTTDGKFMSRFEALWMELSGSKLLVGRK